MDKLFEALVDFDCGDGYYKRYNSDGRAIEDVAEEALIQFDFESYNISCETIFSTPSNDFGCLIIAYSLDGTVIIETFYLC